MPSRSAGRQWSRLAAHGCAKDFYVSPFIDMVARYEFHIAAPGERLAVLIRESDMAAAPGGPPVGTRRPLTDRAILRCLSVDLFMTFKVFVGIHIEALRLW